MRARTALILPYKSLVNGGLDHHPLNIRGAIRLANMEGSIPDVKHIRGTGGTSFLGMATKGTIVVL
jgi:hypothetical protein